MKPIAIRGASLHNLQGLDLDIPKGRFVAITGVSGSGKSTLAFDLLFEEGRRRYLRAIGEALGFEEHDSAISIAGLSPTVAVEQRVTRQSNPRSVVGTRSRVSTYLQTLYALCGQYACPACAEPTNQHLLCEACGRRAERLPPGAFSFNSVAGMCLPCQGRGMVTKYRAEHVLAVAARPLICHWQPSSASRAFQEAARAR